MRSIAFRLRHVVRSRGQGLSCDAFDGMTASMPPITRRSS